MCTSRDKKLASPNRPTINVYDIWHYDSVDLQHQAKKKITAHPRSVWSTTRSWLLKLGQLLTLK